MITSDEFHQAHDHDAISSPSVPVTCAMQLHHVVQTNEGRALGFLHRHPSVQLTLQAKKSHVSTSEFQALIETIAFDLGLHRALRPQMPEAANIKLHCLNILGSHSPWTWATNGNLFETPTSVLLNLRRSWNQDIWSPTKCDGWGWDPHSRRFKASCSNCINCKISLSDFWSARTCPEHGPRSSIQASSQQDHLRACSFQRDVIIFSCAAITRLFHVVFICNLEVLTSSLGVVVLEIKPPSSNRKHQSNQPRTRHPEQIFGHVQVVRLEQLKVLKSPLTACKQLQKRQAIGNMDLGFDFAFLTGPRSK